MPTTCSHSLCTFKMLNSITSPWLFAKWGMDIVDPLPIAAMQKKFLLVAIDYFNKWVEAKAYASIKDKDVSKFIWKNIVCQFEVPRAIVKDNGPQLDNIVFQTFCSKLNIKNLIFNISLSTKQRTSESDKQSPIECT